MLVASKITSKGQITIPKKIRKFLEVSSGGVVFFQTEQDKVFLKNALSLKSFRGVLKGSRKINDLKLIRTQIKQKMAKKLTQDE